MATNIYSDPYDLTHVAVTSSRSSPCTMTSRVAKTSSWSLPGRAILTSFRYVLCRKWRLLRLLTLGVVFTIFWRRFHRPGQFRSALLASTRERKKGSAKKSSAPSAAETRSAELTDAIFCAFRAAKDSSENTVIAQMHTGEDCKLPTLPYLNV